MRLAKERGAHLLAVVNVMGSAIARASSSSYEPSWGELANYLLRSQTGMKVLLTERLALSVEHQFNRTARPPTGGEPDEHYLLWLSKEGNPVNFNHVNSPDIDNGQVAVLAAVAFAESQRPVNAALSAMQDLNDFYSVTTI